MIDIRSVIFGGVCTVLLEIAGVLVWVAYHCAIPPKKVKS